MRKENLRYRIETFHVPSLENNPLGDTTEKQVRIYLPPNYFSDDHQDIRYPVIYSLHGYGANIHQSMITSRILHKKNYPFLFRILLRKIFRTLPTFEKLDRFIQLNQLPPFILVQPDGSLPLENFHGKRGYNGLPIHKGSFYLNSPYTGNYNDYIFQDLIEFIDEKFRTIPQKKQRAVMGGSMGGFGALLGGIVHPSKFNAVVALSPAISWLDLINLSKIIPLYAKIYGKQKALNEGKEDVADILDTADLIFSKNQPLIPSLTYDVSGAVVHMDSQAKANWEKYDLNNLISHYPHAFEDLHLSFNCEENDEYQFASQISVFHETLKNLKILHDWDIYHNPIAHETSAHTVGIAQQLLPAIKFCLKHITVEK